MEIWYGFDAVTLVNERTRNSKHKLLQFKTPFSKKHLSLIIILYKISQSQKNKYLLSEIMLQNVKTAYNFKLALPKAVEVVANSYSELFFVPGIISGSFLLIITFLNPHVAIAGLISVVSAYAFAVFLGYKSEFLGSGFYTYNSLLVGLAIGHIFQLTPLSLLFVLISSGLTFVITIVTANILSKYFGLQILSIPFVIVSSIVYLAARKFPNLYVTGLYAQPYYEDLHFLPDAINGFFRALGAIIFMPYSIVGLVVALMILFSSRILFFLAVLGFVTGGVIQGQFLGSIPLAMMDVNCFNYILIAMAIGGINIIPSIQSYILAVIAVAMSTLLISAVDVFWSQFGIPVFTLPFIIVTLSFSYLLGLVEYRLRPTVYKNNPEQTLDYFLSSQDRFSTEVTVSLPFSGHWTVWQGVDGGWTHQGIWKYAYDFVITDINGETFKNSGRYLEDYYCYNQPVLSPVTGRVIKVVNWCDDNLIGSVDNIQNWGNMVLIHDQKGQFVELSHFKKDSITVKEGDYVYPGLSIGLCGNSGYSPQPHIHLQVQATADMGSTTVPFSIRNYLQGKNYHAHGRLKQGVVVKPALPLPYYDQLTTFILDTVHSYDVFKDGKPLGQIDISVKMAPDGTFYFKSSRGELYFGKIDGTFYFYHQNGEDHLLRLFYLCLNSMPLHYETGISWHGSISTTMLLKGPKRLLASIMNAFVPKSLRTTGEFSFISELEVSGKVRNSFFASEHTTYVRFSTERQIENVVFDDISLQKIN